MPDLKSIFLQALDLCGERRTAFINEACRDQPQLRQRVDALLYAHEHVSRFLEPPAEFAAAPAAGADEREQPGFEIGNYRLLQKLGEGGFGSVWVAEQVAPVQREVALKLVRSGAETQRAFARFEQERQTLALMDHPNVAKVFDGGRTAGGRPYLVMELVRGLPITDYCDRERLDVRARLRLFVQVCNAVQHAHQKGVIHRDLKPSNVLVAKHDDAPVPKVIDFGIAKAIHGSLGHGTIVTGAHQLIGTPEYMAPEQADLAGVDIDTRADIYSLGVLLYEMLTGSRPFESRTGAEPGLMEMLRRIREDEPPRPSTRLGHSAEAATAAAHRRTDTSRLRRLLRGDLDWITMRALAKDRARRYGTAQELGADLLRQLAHEPVLASPPSFVYRSRKLLQRHRGRVIAAAVVLLTLLVGMAGTTWFAIAAGHQTEVALQRQAQFDQLAVAVHYERAVASAQDLFPAAPELVPKLRSWLAEYEALSARRADLERTVRDLRERALPATQEQNAADLQSHPDRAAWQALAQDVAGERRALAVREGAPFIEPPLPPEAAALPAMALGQLAWMRVAHQPGQRTVHGEEALGLTLARAALARPDSPIAPRRDLLDTLAWALFAVGRDAEAMAASRQAIDAAPSAVRQQYVEFEHQLRQHVDAVAGAAGRERLHEREAELARLHAAVHARRTFHFADPAQQFLHDVLAEQVVKLEALGNGPARDVAQRLRWAESIGRWTTAHPRAKVTWDEAAAAVAKADGVVASERYARAPIALRPQLGLVPIGCNPVTRLWEFYDLRSAWDGQADPATIEIPRHAADGSIAVGDGTGIVFVLVPGGTALVGAQATDPAGDNYDPKALPGMGPVHRGDVSPFFLARYELTQGQWARLWTDDAAGREPSQHKAGANLTSTTDLLTGNITYANPVELVDWSMCDHLLRLHGLELPWEAQWEYACRAGTSTPWSCAAADLEHSANLADRVARDAGADWGLFEPWSDGHIMHARVGSFAPNAFGFHDMHGNVWEWCRDSFSGYTGANGERMPGDACRGTCGGAFDSSAAQARSSFRRNPPSSLRSANVGVRAARPLRP